MGTVAAIIGAGTIGAGASLGSGFMQSNAAADAGRLQDRQFGEAQSAQERARLSAINQVAPFRSLGINALPSLFAYYADPNYFRLQQATNQLNTTTYRPDELTAQYGDITAPQTFLNQGPHGGRGLFGQLAEDSNVPLAVRNIANEFLAEQNRTARQDEGSTSYGFNDPAGYAARIKEALAQESTQRASAEQGVQDLMGQIGTGVPEVPGIPASLTGYLSGDNPAFQRYMSLLGTPTERFTPPERFAPTPFEETPEFEAKRALGERYTNRDLAARGLFSSGRASEVLNDFITNLIAKESDAQFGRQLSTYGTNFNRDLTTYGLNQEAADKDIVRAEAGYGAGLTRERSLYDLILGKYGMDFNAAQTRYANLFGLANLGSNAATQSANVNMTAGTNAANLAVGLGNAQANSLYRQTQPYADAISGIGKGAVTLGTLYGLGLFKGAGGDYSSVGNGGSGFTSNVGLGQPTFAQINDGMTPLNIRGAYTPGTGTLFPLGN